MYCADAVQPGSVAARLPAMTARGDLSKEVRTGSSYRSSFPAQLRLFLNDAMPTLPLCGVRRRGRGREGEREREKEREAYEVSRSSCYFRFILSHLNISRHDSE